MYSPAPLHFRPIATAADSTVEERRFSAAYRAQTHCHPERSEGPLYSPAPLHFRDIATAADSTVEEQRFTAAYRAHERIGL